MDRKTLIRRYKETPRPMGVYRVRNIRDGRMLIGRSVNVTAILNRERAQLRMGAHANAALQRDWNALGEAAFAFEIVDTLAVPEDVPGYDPTDDLAVLEALWRERLGPAGCAGYTAQP